MKDEKVTKHKTISDTSFKKEIDYNSYSSRQKIMGSSFYPVVINDQPFPERMVADLLIGEQPVLLSPSASISASPSRSPSASPSPSQEPDYLEVVAGADSVGLIGERVILVTNYPASPFAFPVSDFGWVFRIHETRKVEFINIYQYFPTSFGGQLLVTFHEDAGNVPGLEMRSQLYELTPIDNWETITFNLSFPGDPLYLTEEQRYWVRLRMVGFGNASINTRILMTPDTSGDNLLLQHRYVDMGDHIYEDDTVDIGFLNASVMGWHYDR